LYILVYGCILVYRIYGKHYFSCIICNENDCVLVLCTGLSYLFSVHSLCYIMFGCILMVCAPLTISSSFGAAHFSVCSSNNKRCSAVYIVKTQICWFYSFFFFSFFLMILVKPTRFMQENVYTVYTQSSFPFFFIYSFFSIVKYIRPE
jgi:uncharacterized membrane protein